jgi:TRAP-type C4-dicarboxylate transport system permease small subunit
MSLKYFHLVFLFFAILCDAGFWLWTRLAPERAEALGVSYFGVFAGWSTLALIAYGIWYGFRKSRSIIV